MNTSSSKIETWKSRARTSPWTIRFFAGLSVLTIVVYSIVARATSVWLASAIFNLVIAILVINRNYMAWGWALVVAALGVFNGVRGAEGGIVLVVYGAVAIPTLLTPSARQWVGVPRTEDKPS